MGNTGTIEKATPAEWDDFLDILGEFISGIITEKQMEAKTSLFSNEEELWQFFLNTL